MPDDDPPRSLAARAAAELALIRVVHHYGDRPEFVVLGGLVPALLCTGPDALHAGTTDVDVQVNLEIAGGSVNATRLEEALRNAEFEPDSQHIWRWRADTGSQPLIKFELLADLEDQPAEATIRFDRCENLGAVNLRGTSYATRDTEVRVLTAMDQGVRRTAEVNVAGLAGFLLAKAAAARTRRKPKDWYDIAYVLLNNDYGDARHAASRVREVFGSEIRSIASILTDLRANFASSDAQGTRAYVTQITQDYPELDEATAATDCQLAVDEFCGSLLTS